MMNSHPPPFTRRGLFFLCAFALISSSYAAAESAPAAHVPAPAPERDEARPDDLLDRVEWRGTVSFKDAIEYSFYDPGSERSFWVGRGRTPYGISVTSHDAEKETLQIRRGDRRRTVRLMTGEGKAPRPTVRLVAPSPQEMSDHGGDASGLVPSVTLLPPQDGDVMAETGLPEDGPPPAVEMIPPQPDDEMVAGSER